MKPKFKIIDWANNNLSEYHGYFDTLEEAEEHLCEFLGDNYESGREEYYIVDYK